ncbi:hypothetical protein ABN763_08560 [Spongiivirga sp. MCCC 1A20706]|uniref:tetratricopeptide repeat protein n=1 Tax=Spongiivirga sp. MCCC 1A20706 TaxID=3160963 RepID=UPI003977C91B
MQFSPNEDHNVSLSKFESMLKTNTVFFFDSLEFEDIIHYYLDTGKIGLAKKAIKIGLEQHPDALNLKLAKVELLVFENKLEIAEQLLDELFAIESSNEEIYIQKANIYSKKDEHYKAIDLLKMALTYTEDEADVFSLIGMEYLFVEDYQASKESFMKCLELDQQDYAALYNVIYCFEFLEDYDGAIEYLNIFLDSNPYSEVAWHQLGKQYYTKKMYQEALTAFDFAVIADDAFIGAYFEKGKVLEKMGRLNEAIENYEITLHLDDPTSFAYLRMGQCHEKLGNDILAVDFYYKTVHEDPLLDKGWTAITDFYYRKKDYQKALDYINKAIAIDDKNVMYWKRNAELNRKLHFYEEADIAYQRTVELGNYELSTWISWTDILVHLGEYETAAQTLYQAIEFYPEHAEIEYRLSGVHMLLMNTTKAEYYLKNALNIDAEYLHIVKEVFPSIFDKSSLKSIIQSFKKAPL